MAHCKQTLALALLAVALLSGCSDQRSDAQQARTAGESAFGRFCAGCHGLQGQGRPPAFPPLAGSEWLGLPPEALSVIVLLGLRGQIEVSGQTYAGYMPPMQQIDDERVAAIVRDIKRRWSDSPAVEWTGEDVARVRAALAGQRAPEGLEGVNRMLEQLP